MQQLHTATLTVLMVTIQSFPALPQQAAAVDRLLLMELGSQVLVVLAALVVAALNVAVPPAVRLPHLDKAMMAVLVL